MLDVRRIRVLREVAVRGSMSGAADALNYTPSAVSQQIATLEREIGVALVERGPRSITLTDAGRVLSEHAEIILGRLAIAEMEVKEIAGLQGGRLRLATFRTAGETLTARAVARFHRTYPEVELSLREGEPEEYLQLVKSGELDLALGFAYDNTPRLRVEACDEQTLMIDPIGVALPENHRLAKAATLSIADLQGEAFVGSTPESSMHDFTRNTCLRANFEPTVNFETNDYHVAQALVATGVGISFLPHLATATAHPGVAFRSLDPPPVREIFAVYRAGGLRSPATAAMLELLLNAAAELEAEPTAGGGSLHAA